MACDTCNLVSPDAVLASPHAPCPKCGTRETRLIFPDFTPCWLFDSAVHFHETAEVRAHERLASLAAQIHRETGIVFDPTQLSAAEARVRQVYDAAGEASWTEATLTAMAQAAADELGLPEVAALRVCGQLVTTSSIFEESVATLILVCAFLESMLNRFLVLVAVAANTSPEEAHNAVAHLRGFGRDKTTNNSYQWYFYRQTHRSLQEEFDRLGAAQFWQEWADLRDVRNQIMHGEFPFPPPQARVWVARLLERAIPVFADLQNQFCIRLPAP